MAKHVIMTYWLYHFYVHFFLKQKWVNIVQFHTVCSLFIIVHETGDPLLHSKWILWQYLDVYLGNIYMLVKAG